MERSDPLTYLGNSYADHTLPPLQRARSFKRGLAHRLLQVLDLHRARGALEDIDGHPARLAPWVLDEHAKQRGAGVQQDTGSTLACAGRPS